MSVRFRDQYFTFNRLFEKHEDMNSPSKSYAKVGLSSSWKMQDGTRRYSDWICRFHGKSLERLDSLKKGDFIVCEGSFTREPYEKDGQKNWGDAQMTIFEWTYYNRQENSVSVPVVEVDEENSPF